MTDSVQPDETDSASYEAEYNELADDWKTIETKAQWTLQLAGVLLGLIANAVYTSTPAWFSPYMPSSLLLTVILLSAAVFYSLWAMTIRNTPLPPRGTARESELAIKADTPTDCSRLGAATHRWLLLAWNRTNRELRAVNESKAGKVFLAQVAVGLGLAAMLLTAALYVYPALTVASAHL